MKHGRKEQFSVTIDSKVADKVYSYIEKNDILYKNLAFEQLLNRGFEHIELMERYEKNQYALFLKATQLMMEIASRNAPKNKSLTKYLKLHYDDLWTAFQTAKVSLDIP